jgi:hypothetical protein
LNSIDRFIRMKTLLLPFALFCLVSSPAFANHDDGTLTEVVTDTGDFPFFHVGETFHGWFNYTSDTIDGTFYTQYGGNGVEPNQSLNALIYVTEPYEGLSYGQIIYWGASGGSLTVSNGVVSNFAWTADNGGIYTVFGDGYYTSDAYDLIGPPWPTVPDLSTSGTISFGPVNQVPESASTLWLLCAAVCVCLGLRIRERGSLRHKSEFFADHIGLGPAKAAGQQLDFQWRKSGYDTR